MIIDGKAMAAEVETETAQRVKRLERKGIVPGLATVLVGRIRLSDVHPAQAFRLQQGRNQI